VPQNIRRHSLLSVELGVPEKVVFGSFMKDLLVALIEFFFQGNDDAVEMIYIVRKVTCRKEFAGRGDHADLSGEPVGQGLFKSDDVFACGQRVVGDEYFFDLSGVNIVFPGKQTIFKILVHI
jgi:hypothetical protein